MNEETKTQEAPQKTHNEIVQEVIDNVRERKNTFYFYCPPLNTPSGGIAVLFRMARIMKDEGYNIEFVYEPRINQRASFEASNKAQKDIQIYEKFSPTWINFKTSDIKITPLGDKEIKFADGEKVVCSPMNLKSEDFLFIPEGFPNIMEKTMQVPCKRIVIAQSWFYILNAMNAGQKWQHFGLQDVISVSDAITEYLTAIMPGLKVKQFSQSIDSDIFKVPPKKSEKYPMVAFSCSRGQENTLKTINIIKTFQAFYPHLKWIRFMELKGLSREEFAERMASCAFYLYTDDVAGFGTSPLEAMACGTHVVGWNAFGGKEYVREDNGFWSANGDIFKTAELLGLAIDKWLNGEMDVPELQQAYDALLVRYSKEKEQQQTLKIMNDYENERINELEGIKQQ